jgi:hypothetical protein
MLNHYIGMSHLADAAPHERRLAPFGLAGLGLGVLAATLLVGRRANWVLALLGVALPLMFVGDSFFWMHKFGHHLDKHAPLHIPPFTPQLFGTGHIGQFRTIAYPGIGFWMTIGAAALMIAAALLRRKVCNGCALRGACGGRCKPTLLVGPHKGRR